MACGVKREASRGEAAPSPRPTAVGSVRCRCLCPTARAPLTRVARRRSTLVRYAGGYQYNVLRWVQQDQSVFLIRVDQARNYPDISFLNAVENSMNARPRVRLPDGAQPSTTQVDGVLERAQWESLSPSTLNADLCPQVRVSGTPYTIVVLNELPNVQQDGLVTFVGPDRRLATIPWGAHLVLRVNDFVPAGSFGCQVPDTTNSIYLRAVAIDIG